MARRSGSARARFFRRFSRHFALDVHDRRRTSRGHVARVGSRIFVFPLDSYHGGGHVLRPAEIPDAAKASKIPSASAQIDAHGWIVLAIGFVVSFIVAYASVAWFMDWVRNHGFVPFAIYRIILGAAVLYWAARIAM